MANTELKELRARILRLEKLVEELKREEYRRAIADNEPASDRDHEISRDGISYLQTRSTGR